METKVCTQCNVDKPKTEFQKQGGTRNPESVRSVCKQCKADNKRSLGHLCCAKDCLVTVSNETYFCNNHKSKYNKPSIGTGKSTNTDGYVILSGMWDHPNAWARGYAPEHLVVYADHHNRRVETENGESVHHKNGVKHDNRIENLEMWVSSQPKGQRPEDLVEWAVEIMNKYATESDFKLLATSGDTAA
jgi:hypothetical protein